MEDVLDVYHRPRDPECPVVCLDETSKQLVAETRVPMPAKPGRPVRHDYEYERNGTANLFMLFAPLEGWRHVEVTDRHTAVDYAHLLKAVSDKWFPNVPRIALVQDNLNTQSRRHFMRPFRPRRNTFKSSISEGHRLAPSRVAISSRRPRSHNSMRCGPKPLFSRS